MSKAKSPLAQANKARAAKAKARKKAIRSGLAKLKKAGLYIGNVAKAAGNSYQSSLVKRFADVITGKAKVLKANTKTASEFKKSGGKAAHGRIIVAAEPKERVYAERRKNKKTGKMEYTGRVFGKRTAYGETTKRQVIFQAVFDPTKLPKPGPGERFIYQAHFVKGETPRFDSIEELKNYLGKYGQAKSKNEKVRNRFEQFWASHVSVIETEGDIDGDASHPDDDLEAFEREEEI